MDYRSITFEVPLQHTCRSTGDGLWGMDADVDIDFTKAEVNISQWSDDQKPYGLVMFRHNYPTRDNGPRPGGLLNPDYSALLYTDSGCEGGAREAVAGHDVLNKLIGYVGGSEQGMQELDGLSCDATVIVDSMDTVRSLLIEAGITFTDEEE